MPSLGDKTHNSSSSSFGRCTVQSSSRRNIGRPSRIEIDLSATEVLQFRNQVIFGIHTAKKEPEHTTPDFRFDGIKVFICCFFVKTKNYCKMDSFAESCIVCGIMTFAEMIHRVAVANSENAHAE